MKAMKAFLAYDQARSWRTLPRGKLKKLRISTRPQRENSDDQKK